MFWSGDTLSRELPSRGIVSPFQASKIDCAAYTLTLGAEYFVTPERSVSERQSAKGTLKAPELQTIAGTSALVGGGSMVIPSGHFAFLLTEEILDLPDDVVGFISLKSSVKWLGLINVSGFHVDPGFTGRLVYSVYNAGPSAIHLNRGQDVFLLWIADLDSSASKLHSRGNKPPQFEIPPSLISNVDRPLHSLVSLSEKLERLSAQFEVARNSAYVISIVVALMFAGLALRSCDSDASRTPQTSNVGTSLE